MVAAVVKKRRSAGAALTAAWLVLAPAAARAHLEFSPALVNRYLSVKVVGEDLFVFESLLFGALPAAHERKRIDSDGNGRLSDGEVKAAADRWLAEGNRLTSTRLDGQPLPYIQADVVLAGGDAVGPDHLEIDLLATAKVSRQPHTLVLDPRREPPQSGETEVMADLAADWQLVQSQKANEPPTTAPKVTFPGPRVSTIENRAVRYVFAPQTREDGRPAVPLALVLGSLLAIAGAALLVLELRRRRR